MDEEDDKVKLISWNVNGLRAVVGKGFVDIFNALDADVFCLQETKLQAGQIELDLPGYEQYWNYAERKGYSGTAVFTRIKPLNVTYGMGIKAHDTEGRMITLEYETFYLINVYTPNSKDELARLPYRMEWEDDVRAYLKKLEQTKPVVLCGDLKDEQPSYKQTGKPKKPVIICGDFNVAATSMDIKNPKTPIDNSVNQRKYSFVRGCRRQEAKVPVNTITADNNNMATEIPSTPTE